MRALPFEFVGTDQEASDLLEILERYCTCAQGQGGDCHSHDLLRNKDIVSHLLFVRRTFMNFHQIEFGLRPDAEQRNFNNEEGTTPSATAS